MILKSIQFYIDNLGELRDLLLKHRATYNISSVSKQAKMAKVGHTVLYALMNDAARTYYPCTIAKLVRMLELDEIKENKKAIRRKKFRGGSRNSF